MPSFDGVTRAGLFGPDQTRSDGHQTSTVVMARGGYVAGYSAYYGGAFDGSDAWVYRDGTTVQLGFLGGDYVSGSGLRFSRPAFVSGGGHVVGMSNRYTATANNGRDAWLYSGTTTVQIGLTGEGNTGSAGYRESIATGLSEAGQVIGTSLRYIGVNTPNGRDAWVYDGVSTVQLGFTGQEHTGSQGHRFSEVESQNSSGRVIGRSRRYTNVGQFNGQDAWVYHGGSIEQVGFTGPGYTSSAGRQYSDVIAQNEAGELAGWSQRYAEDGAAQGAVAWRRSGGSMTTMGLTGGSYMNSAGFGSSWPLLMSESGAVAGYSFRYTDTGGANGQDSWVDIGGTTVQVGLVGSGYTTSGGRQHSEPVLINSAGHSVGFSRRYAANGGANGQDVWVASGGTSVQAGLTGPEHTGFAGFRYGEGRLLNDAGQAAGFTARITGVNTSNGADAWVHRSGSTVQVGLTGGVYEGAAGYRVSEPTQQNAAGVVVGFSQRFVGISTANGQDAWYFDPLAEETLAIIGSVRPADNYAVSSVSVLTESGIALGSYRYFVDGLGAGDVRAFAFRPDLGFTDLGELVVGGLAASGWATLRDVRYAELFDTLVGYGLAEGQISGQSVFVMVPAPSALGVLVLAGVIGCAGRRRGAGW